MKKLFLLAAVICSLVSCERVDLAAESETSETTTTKTRNVQFVIKGLDVDYGDTRATVSSEGMTDLYVFEGTTLLKHQTSSDSDFGAPTVSLTIGAHDLTFVTSKSTEQTWADGVWSCSVVKDTYGCVLSYTVSASSTSKQVQLNRLNGKVKWTIEDAMPTTVTSAEISVPQHYGLDASLNGTNAGTCTNTFNLTSVQGVTGVTVSASALPASQSESETISPTITFSNGTTYTTECTLTANIVTNIHGSFFTAGGGLTMELNTDWGTQNDVSLR